MAELPKIVSERLRDQAVAGEHPDANLLSSFAEQGLTEQERAPVLDHLSRCAQCREIVALSTPEAEQEVQVAVAHTSAVAQRSWWRSPIAHWSALAVAALVVLIAVGEHRFQNRERRSASAPAIRYEPPVAQSTPAPAVAPPSQPPSTQAATRPAPATPEPKQPAKGMQATRTPPPAQTFNGLNARNALSRRTIGSADKMATSGGVVAGAAGTAPAPQPPAALPMKPHENPEAGKSDGPLIESESEQAQSATAPSATAQTVTVEAAAPAISGSQMQTISRNKSLAKSVVSPRWSISGAGTLQRSFDGGRNWNQVAVADGVTFRAVSVAGNDVWVGGSRGALFHAADGGEHWSQVRVQMNDRALSGDIVRIEFPDAANGVVSTSTGEIWRTLDSGASWQLQ
jgi:Photosynthesis system II assembly factor YCF48